ncbi:MAG: FIST C-terminal domain-containing protein [Gemmataceae bacterium]|nr:FIST C-terminal domain-containing protein [Gemmataceae bacterium]
MPFAAALSTNPDTRQALAEVVATADSLPGPADLAIAVYSPHHADELGRIARWLQSELQPGCLFGAQGDAVIGTGREVEGKPAISLWLAHWGGQVQVDPIHLDAERTPDGPSLFGWPDSLVDADPGDAAMLLLGDPFTFPAVELFLPRVNEDYEGLRVFGGMASGMSEQGTTVLFQGDEAIERGAVGALLRGPTRLRGVVSQGCRPVGRPLVVTKAKENVIFEIGGQPPVRHLRDLLESLPVRDRELFQAGPHLGLAMTEYKDVFGRGDFLVRNLIGLDPQNGSIAVTDRVRTGQTVQFLVRDATSADDDLREMLQAERQVGGAEAALLFTCNGRGTRLFGKPDHDAAAVQSAFGAIPVAGLHAAGEIGPVAGRNFLHGFTASVALFGAGGEET